MWKSPDSGSSDSKFRSSRGGATVEQIGIVLMLAVALALIATVLLTGRDKPPGRELGHRIANRIACGPRAPGVCSQHPAVSAYGWPLARAIRMLAPPVTASADGLVPVDFRYCQRPSCAFPSGSVHSGLTTANRRTTYFTEVRPAGSGMVEITYWQYRPSAGWKATRRVAGPGELESASGTRVQLKDIPRLVPLEILPGRNHYRLPAGDEPPWRWRVNPRRPGWSA
ncbi:MAG: hypothetical protein M3Y45_09685 [Actinomycetota bacterium]|nr:hypothetical protein [Actinomycetota bacterium]